MPTSNISPDQLKLFRSLFFGREDAYGLETKNGPISVKEPLTDKEIQAHLEGNKRIGRYLLSLDSTITWSAFDFDSITPEKLQYVVAKSIESKLYPYVESSKSRGYHVHSFFDEPIQARPVRALMNWILRETGTSGEIFPKQDVSSNNGLGNFLWFPLQGESTKKNRTLFLNSELKSYPDQWEQLSRIHRTKTENILELVKELHLDEPENLTPMGVISEANVDLAAWLKDHGIRFKIKKQGSRTLFNLQRCFFDAEHTTPDTEWQPAIIQSRDGKITYYCFHAHCANKRWADIRQIISGDESLNQYIKKPNPYTNALLTADYVILLKIPPKNVFINPWFYQQENLLIAGWRGVGKSWFVISLFDAVTREETFGPWNFISSIPCLYIDGEMAFLDIQERLKLLDKKDRKPRKTPLLIYSDAYANSLGLPRANLTSKEWRRDIKSLALDNGIKAIGIDNLGSLAPGIDENSKKDWDGINEWLLDLRFSGITTALLHHTGKGGTQRGTSAHEDNIDCSISLCQPHDYKTEDGARFIVKFKKTRISTKELNLVQDHEFRLTQVDDHVEWTFSAAKKKNQIEILKLLDEGMKQEDIAGLIGVTRPYVGKIKARALKDKQLDSQSKLTKEGKDFVSRESIFDMEEDT